MRSKNLQIILLVLILGTGCAKEGQPTRSQATPQTDTESITMDSGWQEVLNLGQNNAPQAKEKLSEFAKMERPSGKLAKIMLERWNDQANTFYTKKPIMIVNPVGLDDSPQGFRGIFNIEVQVDPIGKVTKAQLIHPSSKKYEKYVEKAVLQALYCPAKPGKEYIAAETGDFLIVD